jgi:hypothetical protein
MEFLAIGINLKGSVLMKVILLSYLWWIRLKKKVRVPVGRYIWTEDVIALRC